MRIKWLDIIPVIMSGLFSTLYYILSNRYCSKLSISRWCDILIYISQPSGDRDRAGIQAADGRLPGREKTLEALLRRAGRTPKVPVRPQGARLRVGEEGRHEGIGRQVVMSKPAAHKFHCMNDSNDPSCC